MNIFETASRTKLRFPSTKGLLTVEDLWDLPLTSTTGKTNLDALAVEAHKNSQASAISFVTTSTSKESESQLRFEILKYIIDAKMAENSEALRRRKASERKQQILQIIAEKENDSLKGASLEDLRKMVEGLD